MTQANTQGISLKDMLAQIEALKAENAALKAKPQRGLTLKVTEKGGLSLYGMGRFPVTLYRGQWERVLAAKAEIEAFIAANADKLTTKD